MWLLVLAYEKACEAAEAKEGGCSVRDERAMASALLDAYRSGLRDEKELVSAMLNARDNKRASWIQAELACFEENERRLNEAAMLQLRAT